MHCYLSTSPTVWLCLRFEQLPLQALNCPEHQPVVIMEKQRAICISDAARALGADVHMNTATLQALGETIILHERQPGAEHQCLQQLLCWAYSITPTVCLYRGHHLLLEIGGCRKLFGGEDKLLLDIRRNLARRQRQAHWGLASTARGAWLLSYLEASTDDADSLSRALTLVPLTLLSKDFPKVIASLDKAGLVYFGDILALPPATLARRCGKAFIQWLQQLLHDRNAPAPLYQPPEQFFDSYWFGYEVKANTELHAAMEMLLTTFCNFLRQTQQQSNTLQWQLITVSRQRTTLTIHSARPHQQQAHWLALSKLQLDKLSVRDGVEGLQLECRQLQTLHIDNGDLFNTRRNNESPEHVLDRLRNRLGRDAIKHISWRDEHLPERALSVTENSPTSSNALARGRHRPFWLLQQPAPLTWNANKGLYHAGGSALTLRAGPERLEDQWWQQATSRDYYIATDSRGQPCWVYFERRQRQWYLQGFFD